MRKLLSRKIVSQTASALSVAPNSLTIATLSRTTSIRGAWAEPGETIIRTIFRRSSGGAMERRAEREPGLPPIQIREDAWIVLCLYWSPMALNSILFQIDAEIARLQQARSLLVASEISSIPRKAGPGRPKKDVSASLPSKTIKKKRNLSPEGRARIAEAVRRRWAAQKMNGKQRGKG
jgi:hypothetical protein